MASKFSQKRLAGSLRTPAWGQSILRARFLTRGLPRGLSYAGSPLRFLNSSISSGDGKSNSKSNGTNDVKRSGKSNNESNNNINNSSNIAAIMAIVAIAT